MTRRRIGLAMAILGFLLLILNAVDYVMGWNKVSPGFTAIAIMLVVIGVGLVRRTEDGQQEEKKP